MANETALKNEAKYPYEGYWIRYQFDYNKNRAYVTLTHQKYKYKLHITLARYKYSVYLKRRLEDWEYVDHINNNSSDDRIENYQLLDSVSNLNKDRTVKMVEFTCIRCKKLYKTKLKYAKLDMCTKYCSFYCVRNRSNPC